MYHSDIWTSLRAKKKLNYENTIGIHTNKQILKKMEGNDSSSDEEMLNTVAIKPCDWDY